jgi:hypothetical protein
MTRGERAIDSRDRALLDEYAVEINTEAEDVLTYQAEIVDTNSRGSGGTALANSSVS